MLTKLPKIDKFPENSKVSCFSTPCRPVDFGFNHFIHKENDPIKSAQNLNDKQKSKIIDVFNPVSLNPDEVKKEETIKESLKIENVQRRGFYKFWELMCLLPIYDKKGMEILIVTNSSNSCEESVKIFGKRNNLDPKVTTIEISNGREPYSLKVRKALLSEVGDIKSKFDLIIVDWGVAPSPVNIQEQILTLVHYELLPMLATKQEKKGTLVCKVYETFIKGSINLIAGISSIYKEAYICKPYISRLTNPEKYCIFLELKDSKVPKFEEITDYLKENKNGEISLYLQDSSYKYKLPTDFERAMIWINRELSSEQQKVCGMIEDYLSIQIKASGFFGDTYKKAVVVQNQTTKQWTSLFLTKVEKIREHAKKLTTESQKEIDDLSKRLKLE